MSVPSLALFRTCKTCGQHKPLSPEFFRARVVNSVVYYRWSCYFCTQRLNRDNRRANPQQGRVYAKRWVAANRERKRQYVKENAEKNAKHSRDFVKRNPEKVKESLRRWRERNPGRYREDRNRRRARKLAAEHVRYTTDDILGLWHEQQGCCYYCGIPVFGLYHVDHKQPLSRGGADRLENLCIACPFCNMSKKDKTEQEFIDYMAKTQSTQKEQALCLGLQNRTRRKRPRNS